MTQHIKITVLGSPISKSNFKLNNIHGKTFLPQNTGHYNDRYYAYEELIAYEIKSLYPNLTLNCSLTALLKVFYKYKNKHPDTNNITKSIFDGIEKSGLIVNDSQITRLYIEELYDKENPRFELELFQNHLYNFEIKVTEKKYPSEIITYKESINSKRRTYTKQIPNKKTSTNLLECYICSKIIKDNNYIKISNSNKILCKKCLYKT